MLTERFKEDLYREYKCPKCGGELSSIVEGVGQCTKCMFIEKEINLIKWLEWENLDKIDEVYFNLLDAKLEVYKLDDKTHLSKPFLDDGIVKAFIYNNTWTRELIVLGEYTNDKIYINKELFN